MSETILLAKSLPEDKDDINMHLISHLKYTYWAARAIWEDVGDSLLKAIGMDDPAQKNRFERILLLAAAHDLGKANSLFQNVVRGKMGRQSIRHEWLLYILLRHSPLGTWFRTAFEDKTDFTYFIWSIIGHHRKSREDTIGGFSGMRLYCSTGGFREILDWIAAEFALESPARYVCGDWVNSAESWEGSPKSSTIQAF